MTPIAIAVYNEGNTLPNENVGTTNSRHPEGIAVEHEAGTAMERGKDGRVERGDVPEHLVDADERAGDRTRQERLQPIAGQPPSLIQVPKGCVFNPRCRYQDRVEGDRCTTERPDLIAQPDGHAARCHIDHVTRQQIWLDEIAPTL